MDQIIQNILYEYSYPTLFGLTFGYFIFLYFGLAPLFLKTCKILEKKGLLNKIEQGKVTQKQIKFEILHSTKSLVIFGLFVLPVIYLIRNETITLIPDSFLNIFIGLVILTLWNEVHFFVVHRTMHFKFFMKHIHRVHHKSKIPTVYSVYSFHWVEATLLSTIPLTIVPFMPFSFVAVLLYPTVSILINYAGHCNYRFGNGKGEKWTNFGTFHNEHHSKGRKNYGFALNYLDKLQSKLKK